MPGISAIIQRALHERGRVDSVLRHDSNAPQDVDRQIWFHMVMIWWNKAVYKLLTRFANKREFSKLLT